ncbi:unnamed protein product [Pedinophyceae sp. YPF-701]|nr:unnamed protein product [Pedinophyceae sp. YPF-701]
MSIFEREAGDAVSRHVMGMPDAPLDADPAPELEGVPEEHADDTYLAPPSPALEAPRTQPDADLEDDVDYEEGGDDESDAESDDAEPGAPSESPVDVDEAPAPVPAPAESPAPPQRVAKEKRTIACQTDEIDDLERYCVDPEAEDSSQAAAVSTPDQGPTASTLDLAALLNRGPGIDLNAFTRALTVEASQDARGDPGAPDTEAELDRLLSELRARREALAARTASGRVLATPPSAGGSQRTHGSRGSSARRTEGTSPAEPDTPRRTLHAGDVGERDAKAARLEEVEARIADLEERQRAAARARDEEARLRAAGVHCNLRAMDRASRRKIMSTASAYLGPVSAQAKRAPSRAASQGGMRTPSVKGAGEGGGGAGGSRDPAWRRLASQGTGHLKKKDAEALGSSGRGEVARAPSQRPAPAGTWR